MCPLWWPGSICCKWCNEWIYLPDDRVCFRTVDTDNQHCCSSPYGWHDPEKT